MCRIKHIRCVELACFQRYVFTVVCAQKHIVRYILERKKIKLGAGEVRLCLLRRIIMEVRAKEVEEYIKMNVLEFGYLDRV